MKNILSFPEFSNKEEEQSGHYLVLKLSAPEGGTVSTKIVTPGKSTKWVVVDDGYCIYRVVDKMKQKIHVKIENDGKTSERVYDLNELILE